MVTLRLTRVQFGVLVALLEECSEAPTHPLQKECEALGKVLAAQAADKETDSFHSEH